MCFNCYIFKACILKSLFYYNIDRYNPHLKQIFEGFQHFLIVCGYPQINKPTLRLATSFICCVSMGLLITRPSLFFRLAKDLHVQPYGG